MSVLLRIILGSIPVMIAFGLGISAGEKRISPVLAILAVSVIATLAGICGCRIRRL